MYALWHWPHIATTVPRSTQPSNLHEMMKQLSASGLVVIRNVDVVVGDSSQCFLNTFL